jgi:hypothetical protein
MAPTDDCIEYEILEHVSNETADNYVLGDGNKKYCLIVGKPYNNGNVYMTFADVGGCVEACFENRYIMRSIGGETDHIRFFVIKDKTVFMACRETPSLHCRRNKSGELESINGHILSYNTFLNGPNSSFRPLTVGFTP